MEDAAEVLSDGAADPLADEEDERTKRSRAIFAQILAEKRAAEKWSAAGGDAIVALADVVEKATEYGTQDGGFVAAYILPTGPIHRAIALLQQVGITVRPGGSDG